MLDKMSVIFSNKVTVKLINSEKQNESYGHKLTEKHESML